MRTRCHCVCAVGVIALVLAISASAEQVKFYGKWVDSTAIPSVQSSTAVVNPLGGVPDDPAWGTSDYAVYTLGPCDAMLRSGALLENACASIQSASSAEVRVGWTLHFPSGASLQYLRLYFHETSLSETIDAGLWRIGHYGDMTPIQSGQADPTDIGDTYQQWGPMVETVDSQDNTYAFLAIINGATAIYKVVFYYKLRVSPAPATASFSDVATDYWAFRHIEALAASGITAGCGGGNYCPESYVKRSEMAVYLAKALGLRWSDGSPL